MSAAARLVVACVAVNASGRIAAATSAIPTAAPSPAPPAITTPTSERLHLATWEKVDFGVTAFSHGLAVGAAWAVGVDAFGDIYAPIVSVALGATAYTLGSVALLKGARPDRGDLPLALTITFVLPVTTLLMANAIHEGPDEKKTGLAIGTAGLLSLPIAFAATQNLDLDPGDTQLVKDAGFWGLVIVTCAAMGFSDVSREIGPTAGFKVYRGPRGPTLAALALTGLYGGMGFGFLGAAASDVSLERVRVATLGGYGGGIVGAVVGAILSDQRDIGAYRGVAIGAALGLITTFAFTGGLDRTPVDRVTTPQPQAWWRRLKPTTVPLADVRGRFLPGIGLAASLP